MTTDRTKSQDMIAGSLGARHSPFDDAHAIGRFFAVCRSAEGVELWSDEFDNLITTLGKNMLLDSLSAASTTAQYMGLISSTSFTAVAAADTIASHSGWLEAGSANTPLYTGTRNTCAWSAASAGVKALSAGLVFTFSGSGTVQGAIIVGGTGAVATIGSSAGILYSAGTLGTAQPVISTNTLTLSYSTTLT